LVTSPFVGTLREIVSAESTDDCDGKESAMKNGIERIAMVATVIAGASLTVAMPAHWQKGQWASEGNTTAKYMIDMERSWAESGCAHQSIEQKILAEDFQGTAPSGARYDKTEALQTDSSSSERECRLDEAKVRFFGDNLALVYGSERALRKARDGSEAMRCLVWTDTWLKRNDNWQVVAAQDTAVPCK
jgi:hypothetical protein